MLKTSVKGSHLEIFERALAILQAKGQAMEVGTDFFLVLCLVRLQYAAELCHNVGYTICLSYINLYHVIILKLTSL